MSWLGYLMPIAASLAVTPAPSIAQSTAEAITISRTPWGLCGGDCPAFDVTVTADGTVLLRRRTSPARDKEQVTRFSVPPRQVARFKAALAPLRPATPGNAFICSGGGLLLELIDEKSPDGPPAGTVFMPRSPIYGVRWAQADTPTVVEVCQTDDDRHYMAPIAKALAAVQLDLDGKRLR